MDFRSVAAFTLVCFLPLCAPAQRPQTKNIIIVTLDGFRWQEFYKGADPGIVRRQKYVNANGISGFLHEKESERRRLLLPFIWNQVAREGQLYGNRDFDNKVNCKNNHLLSYPGYSEMLVGFSHRKISSNENIENPHHTVLEAIEKHASFNNEVAAFTTWGAFAYILREAKSDIYLNAGKDLAEGDLSVKELLLNKHHSGTGVHKPGDSNQNFETELQTLNFEPETHNYASLKPIPFSNLARSSGVSMAMVS